MLLTRRSWLARLWTLGLAVILTWGAWGTESASALGGPQPELNTPAPALTLPTNSGNGEISLTDYRGQWTEGCYDSV